MTLGKFKYQFHRFISWALSLFPSLYHLVTNFPTFLQSKLQLYINLNSLWKVFLMVSDWKQRKIFLFWVYTVTELNTSHSKGGVHFRNFRLCFLVRLCSHAFSFDISSKHSSQLEKSLFSSYVFTAVCKSKIEVVSERTWPAFLWCGSAED